MALAISRRSEIGATVAAGRMRKKVMSWARNGKARESRHSQRAANGDLTLDHPLLLPVDKARP